MISILKDCNNKLTIVFGKELDYIFSYESLIGIGYENTLIIDSYYKNYSKTTDKHISTAKKIYDYFIIADKVTFREIKGYSETKIILDSVIKDYKDAVTIKSILKAKKNELRNDKDYLNLIKTLRTIAPINPLNLGFKELKSVNKTKLTLKAGAVSFDIIKTYSKAGGLKNIKINRIILNPI